METNLIFNIDIQPGVHKGLVLMYDRYIETALTGRQPLMNYVDFVNHIIVRGMTAYAGPLEKIEKELSNEDF